MMRRGGWIWLLLGIVLGIGGGLFYTWQVDPRVITDTNPNQLDTRGRTNYLVALSLAYNRDSDLMRAARRLNELGSSWQGLADTACQLTQTGYASSNAGLIAIRSMVQLANAQGAQGCASALLSAATPTADLAAPTATLLPSPTVTPAATKTPTLGPTFTPIRVASPSPTPVGEFAIVLQEAVCSADLQNVIEVTVRDADDSALPGIAIEVIWDEGRDTFYTGLKRERRLHHDSKPFLSGAIAQPQRAHPPPRGRPLPIGRRRHGPSLLPRYI
jgi:hypothetical protein